MHLDNGVSHWGLCIGEPFSDANKQKQLLFLNVLKCLHKEGNLCTPSCSVSVLIEISHVTCICDGSSGFIWAPKVVLEQI